MASSPPPQAPRTLQSPASLWDWWYWPSFYDLSLCPGPTSPRFKSRQEPSPFAGLLCLASPSHEELKLAPFVLAGSQACCNEEGSRFCRAATCLTGGLPCEHVLLSAPHLRPPTHFLTEPSPVRAGSPQTAFLPIDLPRLPCACSLSNSIIFA